MQMDTILEVLSAASPVSVALALGALIIAGAYFALKGRDQPPGPLGLPYLGLWPFLSNSNCHLKLHEFRKKYGDVFSFRYTGQLYINLGSIKAVREAHINKAECFGGRMSTFNLTGQLFEGGVVFMSGEPWRVLRKFFQPILKERGMGALKTGLSGALQESVGAAVEEVRAAGTQPVNLVQVLTKHSGSLMRLTLFGGAGATDEQICRLNELYANEMECFKPMNILLAGPLAKYFLLPLQSEYRRALQSNQKITKLLHEMVDEHNRTYDEENIRDIIDEFIRERELRRSKGDPTARYFTDKALVFSLMQFVGDGVLSVAGLASILLKILLDHPDDQDKIQKEILEVVGADRLPCLDDKSRLTYLNAFLLEAIRVSDFFPFFPSLECTKETTLNGYRIPKGAVTLINFYSAHYDSEVFEDPYKFDPARFIQEGGRKRPELPIFFGVGKRACLGEGFTMMQVFLFLTSLLQNFHLSMTSQNASLEQLLQGNLLVQAKPRN